MNTHALVDFSERLHDIIRKNADLLPDIEVFRKTKAIDEPQSLARTFEELRSADRLLNVGIVGRVKAGKSSLLNALLFQGESILPKAATPMTAALTTLTWGERFEVEVEFFSQDDVDGIRAKAEEYRTQLESKEREILNELQNVRARVKELATKRGSTDQSSAASTTSPQDMARKQALRRMQEQYPDLCVAADQFERMEKTGLRRETLEHEGRITATNPQELARRLQDYVGADGRFMPFAKAVHISMPFENLQDMRIIDTPGMNDPVQSREARTVELLKTCDVVFIVSPAGQFLNDQDLELMSRITTKEGVQRIVLVASQVDTQLYGSEKRARLDDALASIRENLAKRAGSTLQNLKSKMPAIGPVFDAVIQEPERHLLHSSGVCQSLYTRLDQPNSWDSNEKKTLENLSREYPDYFSTNPEVIRANLRKLANIEALHDVLRKVRTHKDTLLKEKITKLWDQKRASLEALQRELINCAQKRITQIQNTDFKTLADQQRQLEKQKTKLSLKVDSIYEECVVSYRQKLDNELKHKLAEIFEESAGEINRAEKSYTETRRREKDGLGPRLARILWGGGYETYTETVMTIATAPVYSALHAFLLDTETKLGQSVHQSRHVFDKNLVQSLLPAAEDILGDDFDPDILVAAIRRTIHAIPNPDFSLGITIPKDLESQGTLKEYSAEQYKDNAVNFLHDLKVKSRQKIYSYIEIISRSLPQKISTAFMHDLEKRLMELKEHIENANQIIDRWDRIIRQAQEISL